MSENIKRIYVIRIREENSGINKYRILDPHVKLQQLFPNYYIEFGNDEDIVNTEKLKTFDAIFYHVALEQVEQFAVQTQKLKDLGVKLILDIDDYWKYHPEHPYAALALKIKLAEKSVSGIRKASFITTTTEHFVNKIKQYNKNVHCIPNSINFNERQFQIKEKSDEYVNIGYVAGSSHLADIKLLRGLFTSLKNSPSQLQLCGFNVNKKNGYNSTWHKMEIEITDNYKLDDKKYVEFLHEFSNTEYSSNSYLEYKRVWTKAINTYMTIYDDLDICLAPLKSMDFNNFKSNLKMLEAGAKKKPIVVSGVEPYTRFGEHEKNCLIVPHNKEHKFWIKYVNELKNNKDLRLNLGENLYEMVYNNFNLDKTTTLRNQIYQNYL